MADAIPKTDEKKERHGCDMERWPQDGYGEAVDGCYGTDEGEFWVGNGEYGTQVNYCPACGAKAPTQVKGSGKQKDGEA